MPRIAVVGATGYTGFELLRLLGSHGGVDVTALTSETYAGKRVEQVFPALASVTDGTLERFSPCRLRGGRTSCSAACPTGWR